MQPRSATLRRMKPKVRYGLGSVRKRNGNWIGEWRGEPDSTGKRPHLSAVLGPIAKFRTKTDARKALQPHIEEYRRKIETPAVRPGMTLKQFVEDVFLPAKEPTWRGNSPAALKSVLRRHVLKPMGDRVLDSITKADVIARVNEMRAQGYKKRTIHTAKWLLSAIFEEAIDNELVEKTPVRRVSLKGCADGEETRPLTEQECIRIFSVRDARQRLAWRILIQCGLRPGEVAALRRNDVNGSLLRVDENLAAGKLKDPKTKTSKRCVPMGPGLQAELEDWLRGMEDKNPRAHLFTTPSGEPMYHEAMREHIQNPVRETAGIPDLVLKQGRTTFATLCKGDVKDTSQMMGHASIEVTLTHYKKHIPERQMRAAADLDRRLTPKLRLVKGAGA